MTYIGTFKRPKEMGQELADSKYHFVTFGRCLESTDCEFFSKGQCLRSRIAEAPHDVEVVKRTSPAGVVSLCGKCSCKAGKSQRCKHIVGLMLKLNK